MDPQKRWLIDVDGSTDPADALAVAVDHASRVWQLMAGAGLDQYERRFVVEAIGTMHRGESKATVRVTTASLAVVTQALAFLPPDDDWPRRRAVSAIVSAFVELDVALHGIDRLRAFNADHAPAPLSETGLTLGESEARTRMATDAAPESPSPPAR